MKKKTATLSNENSNNFVALAFVIENADGSCFRSRSINCNLLSGSVELKPGHGLLKFIGRPVSKFVDAHAVSNVALVIFLVVDVDAIFIHREDLSTERFFGSVFVAFVESNLDFFFLFCYFN